MSTGGASTTQVWRRGGGRLQPTPLGISSNCLLVPSALTHPQAHAVFPTPRSFVFQNKPWVLRPPSLHSTNPIFLECPSLQFIFLVFIPPPLLSFSLSSSMLTTINFRKPIPSTVNIKCFFPLQQLLHYRTHHHQSYFIPGRKHCCLSPLLDYQLLEGTDCALLIFLSLAVLGT